MSEEQNPTVLTIEQQQRQSAVTSAATVLKDGGASLIGNNGKADDVADIIDLASYIADGVPFSVAHRHSHMPDAIDLIVGPAGGTLSDLVNHLFRDADAKDDTKASNEAEESEGPEDPFTLD